MTRESFRPLAPALAEWLPRQRWFAGKDRIVGDVHVEQSTPLYPGFDSTEVQARHLVVAVSYSDGSGHAGATPPTDRYQVVVGLRRHLPERLEHVRIGELPDGRIAYDGLWDSTITATLLRGFATGAQTECMLLRPEPEVTIPVDLPSRVIDTEQSNTSVVYDDVAILKLFRRLLPGTNPDIELGRALARAGCEHVAPLLGSAEGTFDGEPVSYAMLADYQQNAVDGWAMATASVRDLMAEEDLRAYEVGGDFAAEAHRLGEAVAVVHTDLARTLGSSTLDRRGLADLSEAMLDRLTEAIAIVPELDEYATGLREVYRAVPDAPPTSWRQRIHGDLHLGQTLRSTATWLLIDFEGEPAKPLTERMRPDSPLRDVAGMLRSFDYAAHHLLVTEHPDHQLSYRATEWVGRNSEAFCAGYATTTGSDPREHKTLLRAYELDKAVYELLYETRHRPTWTEIPHHAITRLLA